MLSWKCYIDPKKTVATMGVNLCTFVGARAPTMVLWTPTSISRAPTMVFAVWATPTILITVKWESARWRAAKINVFQTPWSQTMLKLSRYTAKMRNNRMVMSGSRYLHIKAVIPVFWMGREKVLNFAYTISSKFWANTFARSPLPRLWFCLPFSVMPGFPCLFPPP